MLEVAISEAGFPQGQEAAFTWIDRDDGSGWQGGGLRFQLAASSEVIAAWKTKLEKHRSFACADALHAKVCNRYTEDEGKGVAVTFANAEMAEIYTWSIT